MRLLPCLLLLLPLLAPAADLQWKWRDATGRVQFSDRPPPASVPEKDILQRPFAARNRTVQIVPFGQEAASEPAAKPAAPAASTVVERAAAADKARAEAVKKAQTQAKDAEERQQRADNCRAARNQLTQLQAGMRIARVNDKGERELLEDAQRVEETRRAQQVIASECR